MKIKKKDKGNLKVFLTIDVYNDDKNNILFNNNKFNDTTKIFYYNQYKKISLNINNFNEKISKFSNNF
jgi:hypothetical protein